MKTRVPGTYSVIDAKWRRASLALSIAAVAATVALIGMVLPRGPARFVLDSAERISLRPGLDPEERLTAMIDPNNVVRAERMYSELTGREFLPARISWSERLDRVFGGRLSRWRIVRPAPRKDSGVCFHRDGRLSAQEAKEELELVFRNAGLAPSPTGKCGYRLVRLESGVAIASGSTSSALH